MCCNWSLFISFANQSTDDSFIKEAFTSEPKVDTAMDTDSNSGTFNYFHNEPGNSLDDSDDNSSQDSYESHKGIDVKY